LYWKILRSRNRWWSHLTSCTTHRVYPDLGVDPDIGGVPRSPGNTPIYRGVPRCWK
jgi:hypothetical protein